jgi:hypothetical protein
MPSKWVKVAPDYDLAQSQFFSRQPNALWSQIHKQQEPSRFFKLSVSLSSSQSELGFTDFEDCVVCTQRPEADAHRGESPAEEYPLLKWDAF